MTDLILETPNKADAGKLAYVGRAPGQERDSNSWFTPDRYMDAARAALGGTIDLDPFSSEIANERIGAKRIFTEQNSAFDNEWKKRGQKTAWMNPPYSGKLCAAAVTRFISEYGYSFKEGIVLTNNATETKWFQEMFRTASAVCFTNHRIAFWNADNKKMSGNTRGQAFFYFGPNTDRFGGAFADIGECINLFNQPGEE